MPDSSPHGSTPGSVGLCPDPSCRAEFHVPDAKAGDRCPMDHDGEPPDLIVYAMAASGVAGAQPSHTHAWRTTGCVDTGYQPVRREWECSCGEREWSADADGPDARAGALPSAEAIEAGAKALAGELRPYFPAIDGVSLTHITTHAAYAIDAPAIHAAGVQEGRAEAAADPPSGEYVYRAASDTIKWKHRPTAAEARADLHEVGTNDPRVERRGPWERPRVAEVEPFDYAAGYDRMWQAQHEATQALARVIGERDAARQEGRAAMLREVVEARGGGVWHKDGALAQLRQMAQWARELEEVAFGGRETAAKIARNVDAACDAIEARFPTTGETTDG